MAHGVFRSEYPFRKRAAMTDRYDTRMSLPFDDKRLRAYELEFGAGGQRLGCKFLLDDGSLRFVNESEITSEIEALMASLGSPTEGLRTAIPTR